MRWEYFRLADLSAEDLLEERAALSGLAFQEAVGGTARAAIHRYRFPPQETEFRGGEDIHSLGGDPFGKVIAVSLDDLTVDIKKRQDTASTHPQAVFAHTHIRKQALADALLRIGEYVAEHGIEGDGPYRAARDLLLREAPRLHGEPIRSMTAKAAFTAEEWTEPRAVPAILSAAVSSAESYAGIWCISGA